MVERGTAQWDISPWLLRTGEWTSYVLGGAGGILSFLVAVGAFANLGPRLELLAFPFMPVLGLLALLIHEFGHIAGARASGMKPVLVQVFRLAWLKQKRGWRLRWMPRPGQGLAGYAVAYPDPKRSMKRSFVAMISAGPLANLLAALVLTLAFLVAGRGMPGLLFLSAAILNATVGLANLVPAMRQHPSDGLQLSWWLRGFPEDHPGNAFARLMGLSVFGATADELEIGEIDRLEEMGDAAAIVADWFRIKAAQNRGEWSSVATFGPILDARIGALQPARKRSLAELIAVARAEIAFSEAMAAMDPDLLPGENALRKLRPASPHLPPRIEALRHALAGDEAGAMERLAESWREVGMSVDEALARSESRISDSILALFQSTNASRSPSLTGDSADSPAASSATPGGSSTTTVEP